MTPTKTPTQIIDNDRDNDRDTMMTLSLQRIAQDLSNCLGSNASERIGSVSLRFSADGSAFISVTAKRTAYFSARRTNALRDAGDK